MNKKLVFGIIGVVAIGGGITALLLSKKKKEEKEAEQIRTAQEKARAKKELEEKLGNHRQILLPQKMLLE